MTIKLKIKVNHPRSLSFLLIFPLIFLSCWWSVAAAQTENDDPVDAIIFAIMQNLVNTHFFPQTNAVGLGLSVISRDGNVHHSQGFGHRDVESNSFMDGKTLFPVAGLTKTFVSALIVTILSQKFPHYGESVLEMPVRELAPNYELILNDRFRTEAMSFRDLLSLRSCTHSGLLGVLYGAVNDSQDYIYRSRYEKAHCPFRTGIGEDYNSYVIAGDVMAEIVGKPFDTLCQDFLDILGMKDSKFLNPTQDLNKVANLVQGYSVDPLDVNKRWKIDSNFWRQFSTINPSIGLLTTPEDMIKFMSFWLNEGQVGGKQIMPKETMPWLIRTSIPLTHDYGYGLGVLLEYAKVAGQPPLQLSFGVCAPIYSFMTIDPGSGMAIFSSSNNNSPLPHTIASIHYDLHLKIISSFSAGSHEDQKKLSHQPPSPNNRNKNVGSVKFLNIFETPAAPSSFYKKQKETKISLHVCSENATVGHYGNPTEGELEIIEQNGRLLIKYGMEQGVLSKVADCDYHVQWSSMNSSGVNRLYFLVADSLQIVDIFKFKNDKLYWTLFQNDDDDDEGIVFERDFCLENLPKIPFHNPITTCNGAIIGHTAARICCLFLCVAMVFLSY